MKGFMPVYRKELYGLFASPVFYAVAFTFLVISGYFFWSAMYYFNLLSFQASQSPQGMQQLNLTDMVLRPFFMDLSIILLLVCPLLTMRLYAEERKTGTIELLFTYPISDGSTLLAKYAAVESAYLVILIGTLPGILLLGVFGDPHWLSVLCCYLGVFLLGSSFLSIGLFTSAVTQNQIIAAVLSFGALLMFWIISWMKSIVGPAAGAFVEYVSVTNHFEGFAKGVLDSRDVLYYLLFVLLFLFLTLRQMESYRWRG
ncbi:MAG: ABC transporter permease subunit [Syntrophobacteraceae bacterium]